MAARFAAVGYDHPSPLLLVAAGWRLHREANALEDHFGVDWPVEVEALAGLLASYSADGRSR